MKQPKVINLLLIASSFALVSCGKKTAETSPIRKDVTETVFASGILEAKNTYQLTAQTEGYLTEIYFEEGEVLKAGQAIALIENEENKYNSASASALYEIAAKNLSPNSPALAQAKHSIELARQKMNLDKKQADRYERLWKSNSVAQVEFENKLLAYKTSKSDFDKAQENYKLLEQQAEEAFISNKAAKQNNRHSLGKNKVKVVVGGKVYQKHKEMGDYVRKGDIIATIGDPKIIYAKVNIDESNIANVQVGQRAVIQLNVKKDKTLSGTVSKIYPSFDEATQSFLCDISFQDPLDFTIVNTQLQSNIMVRETANALLIPKAYVSKGNRIQLKGEKEKRQITTGFVSNEWVQVLSGVDESAVLVTDKVKDLN